MEEFRGMDLKRPKEWLWYLAAIALPLVFVIAWHSANTIYPNDDCANYYETAQDIYQKFRSEGLAQGLTSAYLDRGWRPLLFPVMAVPFIAISGGEVIMSVASTLAFLYFVFLTYVYLISREFLSPRRSFLSTVFTGTIPWTMVFTYYFMSEMALMACSMAALYHLKKAGLFTSLKHSVLAGLWMGLGLAVRPVEFFLAFGIVTVALVAVSWRKGEITVRDLAATAPVAALTVLLFILAVFQLIEHQKVLLKYGAAAIVLSAIPLLLHKRLRLNLRYNAAFFACNLLVLFWWLPGVRNLYLWVKETTGIVGALYHDRGKMDFLEATVSFFTHLGGYPLLITFALFVIGVLFLRSPRKSVINDFSVYNAAALSLIIPPVFMLSLTTDIAYRRAFVGFSALLLINAVFAVRRGLVLPRLRLIIVLLLTVFQAATTGLYAFDLYPHIRGMLLPFYMQGPPLRGGEPSERFFEKLQSLNMTGPKEIAVLSLSQTQYQERPFDTSALNLVSKKSGSGLRFSYPAVFMNLDEGYALLRKNWQYVVLDVSTGNPANDPYSRLTADLIEKWKKDELEAVGLRYITSIHVPPATVSGTPPPDKTILFLEVEKNAIPAEQEPGVEVVSSSNMFPSDKGTTADFIMSENRTIWHAASPPKYPEWVLISYPGPRKFNTLGIRAQETSPNGDEHTRGPRDFVFQGSNDKKSWEALLKVKGNAYSAGGEWKDWGFNGGKPFRYYRIYIKKGNHPRLLTIKQVRLFKKPETKKGALAKGSH